MINIPARFNQILGQGKNSYYSGIVNLAQNNFEQILSKNELFFFEEYTDHGIRHINSLLEASDNLITSDTMALLNEKDITILILAIFLHDLGMHVQPLTFKNLIAGNHDHLILPEFGDVKWSELWLNYLSEAKKFNSQSLKSMFGSEHIIIIEPNINDPTHFTTTDKQLIGEFIRRHHCRIAYEVAFNGLTTHEGNQLDILNELDIDLRFLSGLVARSHGMYVRDTFDYLKNQYHRVWKNPFNTHIIYLMIVLRIADYLQIDSKRVLKIPFQTKIFKSPFSFFEHQKHLETISVQFLEDDPETLFVTAAPSNSKYYLALENLFRDIQIEIDQSWAIIGEIYGAKSFELQPKLRIRRIQSNLDDKKSFNLKAKYIADKITFTVDPEVPKLLVGPLYGYQPTYGVRELLQNAIDACLEREYVEELSGQKYSPQILIRIEENNEKFNFIIQDNGKGMTVNEIKNYFLKIGGTFRKSKTWSENFLDSSGNSIVLKSGRFGIGVLAAFLLGSEIEVKTRGLVQPFGLAFKTCLNDDQIEISKINLSFIGTVIKIAISKEILEKLYNEHKDDLDNDEKDSNFFHRWYTLKSPKLHFDVPEHKVSEYFVESLGYETYLPGLNENSDLWYEIFDSEYKKISWSYSNRPFRKKVICNGILIPREYKLPNFNINPPALLVFDLNAKLPISLDRSCIISSLSFTYTLVNDILENIIASILQSEFNFTSLDRFSLNLPKYFHPALNLDRTYINDFRNFVFHKSGFVVKHNSFLNRLSGQIHVRLFSTSEALYNLENTFLNLSTAKFDLISLEILPNPINGISPELVPTLVDAFKMLEIIGWSESIDKIRLPPNLAQVLKNNENHLHEFVSDDICDSKHLFILVERIKTSDVSGGYFDEKMNALVVKHLEDNLIIPYDENEKLLKIKNAFTNLERHIKGNNQYQMTDIVDN